MIVLAELLAGLGLLFVGLRLISHHLQQTTGRRMRRLLQSATRSAWLGFAAGTGVGAATQSSNAVTLIAGNLVRSGTLTVRDAVPVVAGANVGTAALVFLASVDLHLIVLYLVALIGLGYQLRFDRHPSRRDWIGAGLGLALLFLGLDFIKSAPHRLDPVLLGALLQGMPPLLAFVVGLAVATVTQSASTATILAVAAMQAGFVGLNDGIWLVLGANIGSGAAVMIAGSGLTGSGRQLCLTQVAIKIAGSALVALGWLAAWLALPQPPDAWLAAHIGANPAPALSILFLLLQLSGGLAVTAARGPVQRRLERLSPPTTEERESRPRYIDEHAMDDPLTAVELATLERDRLIRLLPQLLPDLDHAGYAPAARRAQQHGNTTVAVETEAFVVELIDRHLQHDDLHAALHLQNSLATLQSLQQTLFAFAEAVDAFAGPRPALVFTLSESLRTLTLLLTDAVEASPADAADFALLAQLTGDRGDMLERLRRDLAASRHDAELIRRVLAVAGLFERAVWLLGRLAAAVGPDTRAAA
ncbi:Na/Pi cotransporter family protein [Verticiella sediminum]|uniref:Na/Pi cotransporter family protein n=1 Tax=Verticiella sediminum TaxID=1247510 RepID=A0A556A8B2_9BURK|nr:Na/Pi symporter [Verticiella sediminum]TSH89128.1 Na/Pi cotransporter family protein [Verticiella sediminum]